MTVAEWAEGIKGKFIGNVNWFRFNNKKELLFEEYAVRYGMRLPKSLCGSFTYYIEASLSKSCDFTSGIYVNGHCDPLITYSKWCIQNDGVDQRDHEFSFGENIFLGLNTEGINGNWVTVEVYRLNDDITYEKVMDWLTNKNYDHTKDDELAKIFEKQAWVINGEVNTDFTIQPLWKKGEKGNKFYIKVKDGGKYIKDSNDDYIHARFLRVKNKIVPIKTNIEILTNNSPVKIGDTERKVDCISTCTFKIINFTERGKTVELFNEGKFINKMDASSKFYTIQNINYDYDKSNIRPDAKPILNEIVQFLTKLMPYVPVELGSHTDVRGTDLYNNALSLRMAQSTVDYLVANGVDKERIHAKGYGKTKPLFPGIDISEAMHEMNRRTTLKFLISDKDALPIEYSLIAPNIEKPMAVSLAIYGFSRKGCYHKPDTHKSELIILDGFKSKSRAPVKDGDNPNISYKIYSLTPKLIDFLHSFFLGSRFAHQVYINSCAYYSKADHPTVLLTTYPDAVLTYNIRMSYKDPYFWNNVPVNIVDNFVWLDETVAALKKCLDVINIFTNKEQKELSEKIIEFINEETHKMGLGLHFLYNFGDIDKRLAPNKTFDYTKEYRVATTIALVIMYLIEILIILLIIWFTRGKGAFGRIKKFKSFFKVIDKLDDWGFEVVYPKMAENRTMYFESSLGKISRVVEINTIADPLIGISYEKEVPLSEMDSAKDLKDILDKDTLAGTKLKFEFKGKILMQINVKVNMGSKKIFVKDFLYGLNSASGNFTAGVGISAGVSMKGFKIVKEKDIYWLPIFPPTNLKLEAKLDVDLGGYMTFSRKYGIDYNVSAKPTGVYHQDIIFFSGLKGTYNQRITLSKNGKKVLDSNSQDKPVPFTLIKGDTYTMDKIYIFKI